MATAVPSDGCAASDEAMLGLKRLVCSSFAESSCAGGTTAKGDWPNQAVYIKSLVASLAEPATCLNTSFAADTIAWLNTVQGDASAPGGGFMWTWDVFQTQYYDMPRKAGDRVESPDTLGRKCWAFAYLRQESAPAVAAASAATKAAGLDMANFTANHAAAIAPSMQLCEQVKANCFLNESYDPSRNGTCKLKVARFRTLGFDRENLLRSNIVRYPFTA